MIFIILGRFYVSLAQEPWTKKTDMPSGNVYFGACVINDTIYVVGGAPDSYIILSSSVVYDPATDTWTPRSSMKNKRALLSACDVDGKFYAIGGTQAFGSAVKGVGYMEMYDPMIDT